MPPVVDIVVPSFHQPALTAACFTSIDRSCSPQDYRVIWIDNASTPDEHQVGFDALQKVRGPVHSIWMPENLGFVKATNAGIALSTAPYVLLLNNDTDLPPGWLPDFLDVFARYPDVGLVGPWARPAAFQWQSNRPRSRMEGTWPDPRTYILEPTRALGFWCTMIRRKVIEDVGYLSEEWGLGWGDDDDYCARAQLAGWKLALRDNVEVLHHGGKSFDSLPPEELDRRRTANLERLKQKWGIWYGGDLMAAR